ncbi:MULTISPECIES: hypothetical protein [unclassified Brevundimonas]|uniref:hypothetical protein n=1 Tax=unclassified Brevundimonas TaxID=2622653 RepID=UPI000A4863B2|nr:MULTISPECIES: hypothetical protein [unclassified Brevundimonas]
MTSRVGLIGLASLVGLALSTSASAQTTRGAGGYIFTDIVISSMRGGRTVATTRTDGQGGFRFEMPAGDYDICLDGPGLRSAIGRSGGGQDENHIIGVLIGLLLPAVQTAQAERQLTLGGAAPGPGRDGGRGPSPAARDLCFPYTAGPVDSARAGVHVEPGDMNGDGRPDRRVDPRIPPPDARAAPARAAPLPTVAITGSIRLVR